MKRFRVALLACVLPVAWTLSAREARAATPVITDPVPPGGGRVLLEGGWAVPLGDLADGLDETPLGSGSRPGFELGMRWRFDLSRSWSLAPSLHYVGYRSATGLGEDGEESLSTSTLRYGLELLVASRRWGARPFAGIAPCIMQNRMKGPGKDHVTPIDASSTGFGLSTRAGVRLGDIEISAVYHLNRFSTYQFFATGQEESYNWDTVVLRFGWLLP